MNQETMNSGTPEFLSDFFIFSTNNSFFSSSKLPIFRLTIIHSYPFLISFAFYWVHKASHASFTITNIHRPLKSWVNYKDQNVVILGCQKTGQSTHYNIILFYFIWGHNVDSKCCFLISPQLRINPSTVYLSNIFWLS